MREAQLLLGGDLDADAGDRDRLGPSREDGEAGPQEGLQRARVGQRLLGRDGRAGLARGLVPLLEALHGRRGKDLARGLPDEVAGRQAEEVGERAVRDEEPPVGPARVDGVAAVLRDRGEQDRGQVRSRRGLGVSVGRRQLVARHRLGRPECPSRPSRRPHATRSCRPRRPLARRRRPRTRTLRRALEQRGTPPTCGDLRRARDTRSRCYTPAGSERRWPHPSIRWRRRP